MSNQKSHLTVLYAVVITLAACSGAAVNKKIDTEVKQESDIHSRADLYSEAKILISTTPGLTTNQRERLSILRDQTRADMDKTLDKSIKLRAVLIKALITTNDNEDEISQIENRIKSLEEHRIAIMFDSIEKANTILNHTNSEKRSIMMNSFFEGGGNRD